MATKKVLDFSQVKDGGTFAPKHKPEGEYLGTITTFEDTKSKAGNDMWVFGVALKNDRRAVYPVYCTLNADSLWKLRQVLMACGIKVPKKKLSVDGNRLVGKDLGVCLEDDEYEGKKKSVIGAFFPASEFEGDDSGTEDDEDDDLPDEDDEVEDDTQDEEEESDETEDDTDDSDEDDDSDDEEDEEEPEPAPVKKSPAKKSAPARKAPARAKKKAAEPEDEDDDEMDVDDL